MHPAWHQPDLNGDQVQTERSHRAREVEEAPGKQPKKTSNRKTGEATNYETELEKWGDQGMGRDLRERGPHKPFPAREETVDRYDQDQFQIQRDEEVSQWIRTAQGWGTSDTGNRRSRHHILHGRVCSRRKLSRRSRVVEYENDREPYELCYPAGWWTSSYQAELTAIEHALTMATDKPEQKIRIITDSRSAVQRLESLIHNNKPDTRTENNIQGLLEKMSHNDQHLTMMWCPGHCNIDGNERADKCANEGCKLPQESVSHSFNTAKAVIRRHLKDPPIEHPLANKVYANGPDRRKPMDKELNREQQVTISRLRSGHHTQLNYWRKKTDLTSDDKCRLCGTAPETIQHIMEECPGRNDSRPPSWDLAALAK